MGHSRFSVMLYPLWVSLALPHIIFLERHLSMEFSPPTAVN